MALRVSRRKFLGASAAAGWALSQGSDAPAATDAGSVRVGVVGAGTRGTALLRALLELPGVRVTAVADGEARHEERALGIAEKASGSRPVGCGDWRELVGRADVDAVVVALPCDLHAGAYTDALRAGMHLYAEKPMGLTVEECREIEKESQQRPGQAVHVGFQRRSHPRYREAVEMIGRGELGTLIEGRASWTSSNGPVKGHGDWLGQRARSGDWMVEQAVHIWDLFHWIKGTVPTRAYGHGSRGVFGKAAPGRDVTDVYSASLEWEDGFRLSYHQSWIDPADDAFTGQAVKIVGEAGGLDLSTGTATFRDRSRPRLSIQPGNLPDTRLALEAFVAAVRSESQVAPPITLAQAMDATVTGLMVRKAVDERRVVGREEILGASAEMV